MNHEPRTSPSPADGYGHGERLPALTASVLIALMCAAGLLLLVLRFLGYVRVFPGETALALVLSAATLVFGFWVLRRIRPVRSPALVPCVIAAVWGLTAATGAGTIANGGLDAIWSKVLGVELSGAWGAALTAPVNEELLKLAGIVFVALVFPYALRGPVDGFVFGSLVGLGFQVTENLIYSLQSVVQTGATDGTLAVVQTTVLRVGLTGPGSHWAMSAVAGTAVGLLAAVGWRPGPRRALGAALLVLLAMALHWLLDSPVLKTEVAGVLLKVVTVFATAMVVYALVRHAYRRRVRRALASEGESLGMRRSSATALVNRRGRRSEQRRVARPEQPAVAARQEQILAIAEDRASRYATR